MGYVEGRNVAFIYRGAEQYDQLTSLAAELVRLRVSLIYTSGTANGALAAKAVTTTIPIVFSNGSDPVKIGLVASLSEPGGNVTGVTNYAASLGAKRLELLRELLPRIGKIGFLTNPTNLVSEGTVSDILAAAQSVGQEMVVMQASTDAEIEGAFAAAESSVSALLVNVDAFFNRRHEQVVALAARHRIPASYPTRIFAVAGGLMSYGDDRRETTRLAGAYVGRVLNGEKPADLPVLQPAKFEFVINLKTAKGLGLTFPQSFYLRADEVIE